MDERAEILPLEPPVWDAASAARRIAQLETALLRRNEVLEQKQAALDDILNSVARGNSPGSLQVPREVAAAAQPASCAMRDGQRAATGRLFRSADRQGPRQPGRRCQRHRTLALDLCNIAAGSRGASRRRPKWRGNERPASPAGR